MQKCMIPAVIVCITIFTHHFTHALMKDVNNLLEYDAIVIGAGVSGLAAAQVFTFFFDLLMKTCRSREYFIRIYERLARIFLF